MSASSRSNNRIGRSKPLEKLRLPDRASLIKTGGLALALGVATWLLAPILLPSKLPQDFPRLPDLQGLNPSLRDALKSADRQARRTPESAEAMGKLGMVYHANGFVEQASRAYKIAARLAPGDPQWVYGQAFLEEENGNEEEQLKLLQQTLRLQPNHPLAVLKLADWFFKSDMLDEAARYYQMDTSVPGKGALVQATFGLGRIAERRRDWSKVIEYIAPLPQFYPQLRPPYLLLQEAYEALGQADKATAARQGAARAQLKSVPPPEDPLNDQLSDSCYSSTRLLKQAGRLSRSGYPDKAIQLARRAASVEPADADVRSFIAQTLLTFYPDKPDMIDEGLTQMSEYLRLRPKDPTPLWTFTTDFFSSPKSGAAVERLYALLRPYAESVEAHLPLGQVAEAKGEIAEAISQYEAALKHDPNNSVVHNRLGQVFDRAGKYAEAAGHFQKSIQLDPQNAVLRRNFGIALIQQGSYGQGVKELGEVLRLNPYDVPTLIAIGFALLNLNRVDEAVPKFRDALYYQPGSAESHYGLAFALSAKGRREDALPEVREALRLRPDFPEAQALLGRLGP